MTFLVDTNVLVYRHDARFPEKQAGAIELLRRGVASGEARIAHQAIVEFVAATTRRLGAGEPLMSRNEALVEAEDLLQQFEVVYPNEAIVRLAVRGAATYGLSWFDAHMWAHAEHHAIPVLYSEDFQHGRTYGTVQVINPFDSAG